LCTAAASATTTVSSSVIDASAATVTSSDIVAPSETVRLPTRDYCSAATTTSLSTTTDLDDSTCATATVSPASDSVQLDPLAPSFIPTSVIAPSSVFTSDSVVNNCYERIRGAVRLCAI